jgi:hypothetical protein
VPCDNNNEDGFEEEQEDISIDIMVQNILSFKQIYDYFENAITMAPCEDFKPLGLSQDIDREELNFPMLFFGQPHSNQGTKKLYQTIAQWEFLHKNHNFVTHIPNLFFKTIKVLIHCVVSSSWI